jgi:curli biogenesis system outer membrane secretion channel CsgG
MNTLIASCSIRRWTPLLLTALLSASLFCGPCPSHCRADDTNQKSGKKADKDNKNETPVPFTGVKHRIAVTSISDSAAYTLADGQVSPPASFGSGLVEMLTTSLVESGHFQVFERAQLNDVKNEIAIDNSGLVSPETAVKIGKIKGIEYIITGAVTEFSNKKGGGGVSIGGVSVGSKGGTSTITIDLRIIDTATGEILNVIHAKGNSGSSGTSVGFVKGNVAAFGKGFNNSSLGKAVREAMNNGVKGICEQMDQTNANRPMPAWEGEVLDVTMSGGKPSTLQLEGGTRAGFKEGDELEILIPGKELKNKSGEVLGRKPDTHIARCRVTSVQEKLMTATLTEVGSFLTDDIKTYVVHRVSTGQLTDPSVKP